FSRYVVGWMVAPRESAELARMLIEETCEKQEIQPNQLDLHADRGSPSSHCRMPFVCPERRSPAPHALPVPSPLFATRSTSAEGMVAHASVRRETRRIPSERRSVPPL